jgi:hypothetical protein
MMRDQGANADDRMINVFRELIADRLSNLMVGVTAQTVCGRKRLQIWHRLQIPNNDVSVHQIFSARKPRPLGRESALPLLLDILLDDRQRSAAG